MSQSRRQRKCQKKKRRAKRVMSNSVPKLPFNGALEEILACPEAITSSSSRPVIYFFKKDYLPGRGTVSRKCYLVDKYIQLSRITRNTFFHCTHLCGNKRV